MMDPLRPKNACPKFGQALRDAYLFLAEQSCRPLPLIDPLLVQMPQRLKRQAVVELMDPASASDLVSDRCSVRLPLPSLVVGTEKNLSPL